MNERWSRTEEDDGFFIDEDRLRAAFYAIAAAGIGLLGVMAAGLWRLERAAMEPPVFVGIASGWVFSGAPQPLASVIDSDFDRQLSDTVEVLFSRTEKGVPPALHDYCAPEVIAFAAQAYPDGAGKHPAGFVRTLEILEARAVASNTGFRRMRYRGLLSSCSLDRAQTEAVYLDATFVIEAPSASNAAGWRLVRVSPVSREEFYRADRERAIRKALDLPADPRS
jgi:hypothetical protein